MQLPPVFRPWHVHRAERFQMIRGELRIEELKAPRAQSPHQVRQRDLRSVGAAREHAFAEKRRAKRHAENPAGKLTIHPHLDRMGIALRVQPQIGGKDIGVDPGLGPVGAGAHGAREITVHRDLVAAPAHPARQAARDMERVQREDAARLRIDPENLGVFGAVGHRENASGIGAEHQLGRQGRDRRI